MFIKHLPDLGGLTPGEFSVAKRIEEVKRQYEALRISPRDTTKVRELEKELHAIADAASRQIAFPKWTEIVNAINEAILKSQEYRTKSTFSQLISRLPRRLGSIINNITGGKPATSPPPAVVPPTKPATEPTVPIVATNEPGVVTAGDTIYPGQHPPQTVQWYESPKQVPWGVIALIGIPIIALPIIYIALKK